MKKKKMTKEERRLLMSHLGKLSHKKSPRTKKQYSEWGEKGRKAQLEALKREGGAMGIKPVSKPLRNP